MTNQEPASAMKISQRLHDRPITNAAGRSHDMNSACKCIPISFFTAVGFMVVLSACASDPSSVNSVAGATGAVNAPGRSESYEVGTCLLPGQVRQLGTHMTYVTERRSVRTTKEDCTIRGGEYMAGDLAD
jgi:hypothetical protein